MSANSSFLHQQSPHTWPKPPLANSYWVVPGKVLAGEYPGGSSLAETSARLQKLLSAGVTLFVNLTYENELPAYDELFEYVQGESTIAHSRHRIKDHSIPSSSNVMEEILNTLDAHGERSGVAYVHCRAGIGRTGTVVGCYLVRAGMSAEEALDRLNTLWLECERSRTWPSVPETDEQIDFIRRWEVADSKVGATRTETDRRFEQYAGAILGMAIGDALGAAVTPPPPTAPDQVPTQFVSDLASGGPHGVPRGAWLADTAMCWSLAESLLACNGSQPQDQMQRYLAWQRDGQCSSTGVAVNVPNEVGKALAQWQWTRKPIAGSHDPNNKDAHVLARTLASVLYFAADPARALIEAGEAARTTLQSPIVLDACRAFAVCLLDALSGVDKDTLLGLKRSDNAQRLRRNRMKPEVMQLMDGWWRGPAPPSRTGRDVLSVFSTALWAFDQTDNFRDGVLLAVNSSVNPSSSGAVFGALAGAYYGNNAVPVEWRRGVLQFAALTELAQRLAAR